MINSIERNKLAAIVVGACNEFAAKLSTTSPSISVGSSEDSAPIASALQEFFEEKGLHNDACDHDWERSAIDYALEFGALSDLIKHNTEPPFSISLPQVAVINAISRTIYYSCVNAGWYTDLNTGKKIERNFGEVIALMHSELSEALEGYRKDKMDDHLPHRTNMEVELADCVIRILDTASALNMDIGGAIAEKFAYNQQRPDHKVENRIAEGGKKI